MGVGLGMDMFDCVLPTRVARHGGLFTPYGRVNIKSARFRTEKGPIEEGCDCYTCRTIALPMSIILHVPRSNYTIAWELFTIYVLCYAWPGNSEQRLSQGPIRPFRDNFLAQYTPASEKDREDQREKWKAARSRQPLGVRGITDVRTLSFSQSHAYDAAMNMAIDKSILTHHLKGEVPPTLRVFRWSQPSISLGRFQSIEREI